MKQRVIRILVVAALLATLAAFLHLSYVASRGGESAPLYSNRRFDPYGTAALYRLMQQRGQPAISLERPRLSREHHGVLLQVIGDENNEQSVPAVMDPSGQKHENPYRLPAKMVLEWVAQGNTLIQMTRHRTKVMDALGIATTEPSNAELEITALLETGQIRGAFPDQLPGQIMEANWTNNQHLSLRAPLHFDEQEAVEWRSLASDDQAVVAGQMRHGRGQVIWIGAPTPALNGCLADADNLDILLSLFGDEPVIFDEWTHNIGQVGSVIEVLKQLGLAPLLLQVLLMLMVYRWSTAGRRQIAVAAPVSRRSSLEQIDMLGHLYDEAWDVQEKLRRVHDEACDRLAKACRCNPADLAERLAAIGSDPAKRAQTLLHEVQELTATMRPRCLSCGYDLSTLRRETCPECGAFIPRSVRRLMQRHELADSPGRDRRWSRRDLARILTESHHLSKELARA